jgi:cell division protein FtsB
MARTAINKTKKTPGLQSQVRRERKKRAYVFFLFALAIIALLSYSLFFGDMGVFKYFELRENRERLEQDIATLNKENRVLKEHVNSLKKDPYYIEKYAREEYGLAKPDEVIFQIKKKDKQD